MTKATVTMPAKEKLNSTEVNQSPINKKQPSYEVDKAKMTTKDSGKKYKAMVKSEDFKDETTEVLDLVFEGAEISEETKDKISTLFASAVAAKVNEVLEAKEPELVEEIREEANAEVAKLAEEVDEFLGIVTQQWLDENKVAIATNHKIEVTEKIVTNLKGFLKETSIEIPEDKADYVAELEAKVLANEETANRAIAEKIEVARELNDFKRKEIVAEATKDLSESTKDKVSSLAESVTFINADNFKKQVRMFAEAYAPKKETVSTEEVITESVEVQQEEPAKKDNDKVLSFLGKRS